MKSISASIIVLAAAILFRSLIEMCRSLTTLAMAAFLATSCETKQITPTEKVDASAAQLDPVTTRLNREAASSGLKLELRQLHARQRFGQLTVTGTTIDELFDPWFLEVYEIAPQTNGWMKMAPHGVVRGGVAGRGKPATIDLSGKSPLEALNLICDALDAYFAYTEDYSVIVAASREELKSRPSHEETSIEDDPFALDEENEAGKAGPSDGDEPSN